MKLLALIVKKIFKILSYIIIVLSVMIVILSLAAKIKENKIAEIVLQRIEQSTRVPIAVNNVSLNLIRRFPLATIKLDDVWIGSPENNNLSDSLTSNKDTLAFLEKIYVSVKSKPLFKGQIEIMMVEIKGLDFSYRIDEQGISNLYFLNDTTQSTKNDTSSINLSLMLKELLLRDVHCSYHDNRRHINARLEIPRAEINGKIEHDHLYGSAKGSLKLSDCSYKDTKLCLMRETGIDFDLTYLEDTVKLDRLYVETDGAELNFTGMVLVKDTVETDINVRGKEMNITELFKYVPDKIFTDIGINDASGFLTLNGSVKGCVSDSKIPEVKMDVDLKNGSVKHAGYPLLKNISMSAYITNGRLRNNKTTGIVIRKFHAETEQSKADMSLSIYNLDRIQYKIDSDIEVEIGELKPYFPDSVLEDAIGHIQTKFSTKGILPDSVGKGYIDYLLETSQFDLKMDNLLIKVNSAMILDSLSGLMVYDFHHITARDFKVKIPSNNININNLSFNASLSGKVSDIKDLSIDLRSYQVKTNHSAIYGTVKIQDLKNPEFTLNSDLKLNLNEIKGFLPDTLINHISGDITVKINSHGKVNLDSISSQLSDLVFKNSTFMVNFNKVSLEMQDTMIHVKEFTGNVNMKPDTITINNTRGIFSDVDFSIDSTKIVNLYNSVLKNQKTRLIAEGRFYLGDLDYSMVTPFLNTDRDTIRKKDTQAHDKDDTSKIKNFTWQLKGKLGIGSMAYKNARVTNISGLLNLSDSLYLVDKFMFDGFDGKINTSVRYEIRDENEKMLWVKNSIEKMDVVRLLKDFDNFKDFYEPAITFENLSGILSSAFDAQILFKNDSIIRNKMYVRGDVKLEKGGIFNYQPVIDMEEHLKGIGDLSRLEFKTINSSIFVFQDAVYVPSTLIVSNKLDATALGMQSFGEDYSYHFIVFLRDILTGKNSRLNEKQDKIGDEISSTNRKGTMVKSYSIDGKSRSGLDNKNDQEKMSSRVKASEGLLNLRFHPYLINYDTGVK